MKEWIIVQAENSFVNSVADSFAKNVICGRLLQKFHIQTKKKM